MKWIFFAFLAVAVVQAHTDDDYWEANDDYGNYYDYDPFDDDIFKGEEKIDQETDKKIKGEIKKFKDIDLHVIREDDKKVGDSEDYQVEDNREKPKDEVVLVEDVKDAASEDLNEHLKLLSGDDSVAPLPENNKEAETVPKTEVKDFSELKRVNNDIIEEMQKKLDNVEGADDKEVKALRKEIIEQTKKLLDDVPDQMELDVSVPDVPKTVQKPPIEDVIAETKQILKETDDSLDENPEPVNDEISIKVTDEKEIKNEGLIPEDDTVDKAYDDLNKDLDKLFDTLDKLTKDEDTDSKKSTKNKSIELEDPSEFDNNNMEGSEESPDDEEKEINHLFEDLSSAEIAALFNDEIDEPNPDDSMKIYSIKNNTEIIKTKPKVHPIAYLDDALIDDEIKEVIKGNMPNDEPNVSVEKTVKKPDNFDNLSSAELEVLNEEFIKKHYDEINVRSPNFDTNVAPIHITLQLDEPTVITSPNYPSPYTTNNIVDWILEGNGMGIEMNITDFAVNSANGDYLFVKPGGVDESGHDGLLFSYNLNSVRKYRFFDVDRMFIRFKSELGMMWMRGFSISLKMIAPRPNQIMDPLPEPEEVVQPPNVTARVHLAIPIPDFKLVKEDFRLILSDMVTLYMEEKAVVLNDMDESTEIISTGTCPINWPNAEQCTAVTFGVVLPEENDEIDLSAMWNTYKDMEPFISQLALIGITDMSPPDMSIMTVWLLIGAGVLISMALLAFGLWRFTCFEDYTRYLSSAIGVLCQFLERSEKVERCSRMKTYSETDSIAEEKRGLDLYPTPHQTLPPLFANEYQFPELDSAKVDMGGFANKSYARDAMYDFESDEEVVPPRDRNNGVSPRDFKNIP